MHDAPRHRSLESLRKEAKRWHAALETSDDARQRLARILPSAPAAPTLRDVQHALALELGAPGWASLKERLIAEGDASIETVAQYDAMAAALLEAYRTGTPAAMEAHWNFTWHRRAWAAMRTYVQIDLGRTPGPDVGISLDDARWLVAREHGSENWAALLREIATTGNPVERMTRPMGWMHATQRESEPITSRSTDWRAVLHALSDPRVTQLAAHGQMTDARAAQLAQFTHLTSLRLDGSQQLGDDGIRALAALPHLQHLDLQGTAVTDSALAAIATMPALRSLSLAWTGVTDAGIAALSQLEHLEHIDLSGTPSGDGAIRAFASAPKLRHFRGGANITDDGIPAFHDYPVFASWQGGEIRMDLTSPHAEPNSLMLRGHVTDRGIARLVGLNGLFALDLDDARLRLSARSLEPLVALPRLGWLAFDAKDDTMPVIARFQALRFLLCQDTTASDAAWSALGASQSIESIWGRRCYGLGDRGFAALSRIPTLARLSVSCLNVSDEALAALPAFPALRELMPLDVPDAGYRHIGACENLESLVLMYCRETNDAATQHITRLRKLVSYFASYTQITDETPRWLSSMDSLERVTFDSCAGLTDDGVASLARLPRLAEVRLSGQQLTAGVVSRFPGRVTVHYSV